MFMSRALCLRNTVHLGRTSLSNIPSYYIAFNHCPSPREEQYRQMWAELEKFVRAHAGSSSMHQRVLDCVLDCKRPSPDEGRGGSPGAGGDDRKPSLLELEQAAWKELDRWEHHSIYFYYIYKFLYSAYS